MCILKSTELSYNIFVAVYSESTYLLITPLPPMSTYMGVLTPLPPCTFLYDPLLTPPCTLYEKVSKKRHRFLTDIGGKSDIKG